MLEIQHKDVESYSHNGFVVSDTYLSDELQTKILNAYDEFIENNRNLTLEEMSSPHLNEGVGAKHNKSKELSRKFLEIGKSEEIVSQVKKILSSLLIFY